MLFFLNIDSTLGLLTRIGNLEEDRLVCFSVFCKTVSLSLSFPLEQNDFHKKICLPTVCRINEEMKAVIISLLHFEIGKKYSNKRK